ncbi:MAG: endoribonuclease YbeY [Cyclobacteriaceae bacterium]|nr:MAG: endoribonuclease YbeY [Cyclobacteriaceae bacterium]
MGLPIRYFYEGTQFRLPNPLKTKRWLLKAARQEGKEIGNLNYIFCSDRYLLRLNIAHLNHRTLTDIITFQYHTEGEDIEGDVFISIPRVRENARKYRCSFTDELHRVMAHGLLHLMGYGDKKPGEKEYMRKKEEACLSLR